MRGRKPSQTDGQWLDVLAILYGVRICADLIEAELRDGRDPEAIKLQASKIRQTSRVATQKLARLRKGWVKAGKPELWRVVEQKELFKDY